MNNREKYLEDARNSSWNLFDADDENEIVVGNESTLSQELMNLEIANKLPDEGMMGTIKQILYQEIEERR